MTVAENVSVAAASEDAELLALAKAHGTPLYVYDLPRLRRRIHDLRAAFSSAGTTLYFATMANDRLPVLRLLAESGLGACINSMPHLELAMEAGFSAGRIQFTSTGMTHADMGVLQDLRIRANLDSLAQLETWFALGAIEGGLRVNAAALGRGLKSDRIGVDATAVPDAVALARGKRLAGLHIYVGTNFQHPDDMLPTLDAFFELAATVPELQYVNIGGGIGIDYARQGTDFDINAYGAGVGRLAKRLRASHGEHVSVIVEPGRGLAAQCGTFLTSVTDVKMLSGQRFASVDGSVAIFPRPFHHPETPHHVRLVSRANSNFSTPTLVVGRTTFSRDILGTAPLPPDLRPGDVIAFDDAGAYSQSMMSRFLGQPEPQAVFVDGEADM